MGLNKSVISTRSQAIVAAPPFRARDDYVSLWDGDIGTINILLNDSHPADAVAKLGRVSIFAEDAISLEQDGTLTVNETEVSFSTKEPYYFLDANGTKFDAEIILKLLDGTPGLTITNTVLLNDETPNSGVVSYDMEALLDPLDIYGTEILSVSATHNGISVFGSVTKEGVVSVDFAQFDDAADGFGKGYLSLVAETKTPNGATGTASFSVPVDIVSKASNAPVGINGAGIFAGTANDDTIRAGTAGTDFLLGGAGADSFVFADTSNNGVGDLDVVLDYGASGDEIRFEETTVLSGAANVHGGVILLVNGGEDTIFVAGDGLEYLEIDLNNWTVPTASPQDTATINDPTTLNDGNEIIFYQQLWLDQMNYNVNTFGNQWGVPYLL